MDETEEAEHEEMDEADAERDGGAEAGGETARRGRREALASSRRPNALCFGGL